MRKAWIKCFVVVLWVPLCTGCATMPYQYGVRVSSDLEYRLPEGEPQIEVGRPVPALDWVDWIWPYSLLGKLVLWNRNVDSHVISQETIDAVQAYLEKNELHNVKVRVNQYRPGAEWRRLVRNRSVGAGWRYTLGVFTVAQYTVMPGRFFGGDNYNPFSNTINLYSDIPAVGLHEAAHAKDVANRTHKGTYSFLYMLPFVPLYHEAVATGDAIAYTIAEDLPEYERQAYHVLYPAYMTYVGGSITTFYHDPIVTAIQAGLVIPGHIAGRIKGARVAD